MAEEQIGSLDGPSRAAVLLLTLGEDTAAQILRHMGPREVQAVGQRMAGLENVTTEQVRGVIDAFLDMVGRHTALGIDSESFLRNSLNQALGEDKAGNVIDRIMLGANAHGLETLKWMEPRAVADMIRFEHPQIISLILAYLDSDQAAGVVGFLPPKTRVDVVMRVATLDAVQPAALTELNDILERQVAGGNDGKTASVGGTRAAAEILNFVDSSVEAEVMEQLKEVDADLGQQIQDLMFVFENLIDIDDTAVQALLREVSSESLLVALKGTDDNLKEKFFANMSKRASEMMRDDLEAKGPVRVSEVEAAQKEILTIARRLADEGQIALGGKGGDDFV